MSSTPRGYKSGEDPIHIPPSVPLGPAPGAQRVDQVAIVLIETCCNHFEGVVFIGLLTEATVWIEQAPALVDGAVYQISRAIEPDSGWLEKSHAPAE